MDTSTSSVVQNTSNEFDASTSSTTELDASTSELDASALSANASTLSAIPCTTPHLQGSRVISLDKLHDSIHTITCTRHWAACESPVELIGEVKHDGHSISKMHKMQ